MKKQFKVAGRINETVRRDLTNSSPNSTIEVDEMDDVEVVNGNGSFRGYSPVWPIVFVKRTPPKEKVGKIHLTDQSIAKVSHADGEIVAVPPENTWPKNSDIFIDERLRNGKAVGKKVMYGLYTGFDFDPDSETAEYGKDVITMIRFDEIKGILEDE